MTTAATTSLVLAAIFAVTDWYAVARARRPLEHIAKPAATSALALTAATLDAAHPDTQVLFVAALLASLVGDVFLMLDGDHFVPGLASFLVAQVLYTIGLALAGGSLAGYVIGAVVAAAFVTPLAARFLAAARSSGHTELTVPLVLYMSAISAMLVSAIGSGNGYAMVGALAFVASDALIAETRFVGERPGAPVAIMVTYHVAQAGLVLSLLSCGCG